MRIVTLNAAEMKSFNRRRILEYLRTQSASRADLSRATGLTRSAISLIVDGLIRDGILREGCEQGGRVGRKSVSLVINPGAFYSIGLAITYTGYSVGLSDFGGTVHNTINRTPDPVMSARDTLELIGNDIDELLKTHILPGRFLGLGISAPGPLDAKCGIILDSPNLSKWSGIAIAQYFHERIQGAILLENNANALALAEKTFCMKGAYESFLVLVVDTNIGAGLIIDGDLYKGGTGFGNEFGHTSINMNGPRCGCGNYGCAEMYASIPNLLTAVREQDPNLEDWEHIVDLTLAGDASASAALDREAEYLTHIIVNAVNILDIEAIVLSGSIAYRAAELSDRITAKVNDRYITRDTRRITISASRMGEHSPILSSANLVLENYVRIGEPG